MVIAHVPQQILFCLFVCLFVVILLSIIYSFVCLCVCLCIYFIYFVSRQKLRGYAHFDMCIFTLSWWILTPKIHFVQFYLKVASYFLPWGKNKNVTLGKRLLWKYIKNENWYTGNRYIFCHSCQSRVNLKLKIWCYNEKNMGFHLTPKKYYFRLSPGGWDCNGNIQL